MASGGDSKRAEGAVASSSSYPTVSQAADEPVQTPVTPAGVEYSPRALELLKQWPIVELIIERSKQAYTSIKQSNSMLSWSLNKSEQVVNTFSKPAMQVFTKLRPLVKLADIAVTEGLEHVQKYFPLVNESPEKVYKDLKNCMTKKLDPMFHKVASVSDVGKCKLHSAAEMLIKIHRVIQGSIGGWIDYLGNSLNRLEAATSKSVQLAPSQPLADFPPASGSSVLRLGFSAATAAGFFYIGAAFWLAARLPVVGSFFEEAQAAATSTSSSTEAHARPLTTPSHSSLLEATKTSVEQPAVPESSVSELLTAAQ